MSSKVWKCSCGRINFNTNDNCIKCGLAKFTIKDFKDIFGKDVFGK